MKSELDALIAKYKHVKSEHTTAGAFGGPACIVADEVIKDLKALRDKINEKPQMRVY